MTNLCCPRPSALPAMGGPLRSLSGFLVASALFLLPVVCRAATVTLTSIRDNSMYSESPDNSDGAGYLFAGRNGGGGIRRALVKFDIAGIIPAGAQIDTVELHLNVSKASFGSPLPASVHRLTADWGEAGSNAGARSGAGAPAQPGDATWTSRFFGTSAWTTPGGDFAPTRSATGALAIGSQTIASSPGLVADVQGWLSSPGLNFGWIVRGDESEAGTARRIDSREISPPANRPTIIIQYTVPTAASTDVPIPGWASVILGAALLFMGARCFRPHSQQRIN